MATNWKTTLIAIWNCAARKRKNGEQWVMHDVDRGAQAIKAVTGPQPRYVRPPDWIITSEARRDLEHEGYRVLTISSENPMALRE